MSALAEAFESVVSAIDEEAQRGGLTAGRRHGLFVALDSLRVLDHTRRREAENDSASPTLPSTPQVRASKPGYVAWLHEQDQAATVQSLLDFTIWQRSSAGWFTPGSDAAWSTEDLSVRGPFVRMVPVQ